MKLEEKLSLKDNLKLTELTEKKHLNRIYHKREHLAMKFEKLLKQIVKTRCSITLKEKSEFQDKTLLNFTKVEIPSEFRPLL